MVGFSLGGGQVLGYAPQYADQVAVVVVMYPLTKVYKNPSTHTVGHIEVPVLMLAGESDHFDVVLHHRQGARHCQRRRGYQGAAAAHHLPECRP